MPTAEIAPTASRLVATVGGKAPKFRLQVVQSSPTRRSNLVFPPANDRDSLRARTAANRG